MEIRTVALKDYSSLRVGGNGQLVVATTIIELVEALMYAKREGLRARVIGEGTNTFFANKTSDILFIKNEIKGISLELKATGYTLQAGSGEHWDDIVQFSVDKGLWGLENLSYIPGSVGAAPVQNIGAYGAELKDVFVSLEAIDLENLNLVDIDLEACGFGYRDSIFKKQQGKYCIVSVTMNLSTEARPTLTYKPLDTLTGKEYLTPADVRELVISTRKAKLPDWREHPNAGSFFKNPIISVAQGEALRRTYPEMPIIPAGSTYKIPAAWLIEHIAHMKGVRVGDVGTWPEQPLVIVNYGVAAASEILTFSTTIITKVKEATGIELEREVNYVQ